MLGTATALRACRGERGRWHRVVPRELTLIPIQHMSSAVRSANRRRFLEGACDAVAQIACGLSPSTGLPRYATLPVSGRRKPVMALKIVVLPARSVPPTGDAPA